MARGGVVQISRPIKEGQWEMVAIGGYGGEGRNDSRMAVPRRPAGGRVNHGGSHDFRYDRNNHNNEVPTVQEDVARVTDKGKIVVIYAHGSNMQMNVGSCTAGSSLGNTHLGPIEKKRRRDGCGLFGETDDQDDAMEHDTIIVTNQPFLLAGPGNQACQGP